MNQYEVNLRFPKGTIPSAGQKSLQSALCCVREFVELGCSWMRSDVNEDDRVIEFVLLPPPHLLDEEQNAACAKEIEAYLAQSGGETDDRND